MGTLVRFAIYLCYLRGRVKAQLPSVQVDAQVVLNELKTTCPGGIIANSSAELT
jgi:hypothetical protein